MEDFHKLRIYRESRVLLREVLLRTRRFPSRYHRIASQLEEATDSIGSNIAEGCGRKNRAQSNVELIRYVHISFGEACEVEHRLGTACDRHLLSKKDFYELESRVISLKRQMSRFVDSLRENDRGNLDD